MFEWKWVGFLIDDPFSNAAAVPAVLVQRSNRRRTYDSRTVRGHGRGRRVRTSTHRPHPPCIAAHPRKTSA